MLRIPWARKGTKRNGGRNGRREEGREGGGERDRERERQRANMFYMREWFVHKLRKAEWLTDKPGSLAQLCHARHLFVHKPRGKNQRSIIRSRDVRDGVEVDIQPISASNLDMQLLAYRSRKCCAVYPIVAPWAARYEKCHKERQLANRGANISIE